MNRPILYSQTQARLMVSFAVHSNPALARRPASAILEMLGLRKDRRGYLWNPERP